MNILKTWVEYLGLLKYTSKKSIYIILIYQSQEY